MRKVLAMVGALALAAVVVAQDVPAGPKLTAYGMAQYRLRMQTYSLTPDTGSAQSKMGYANQVGYMAGLKVKINDNVSMQFQAGNDFVSTEGVSWAANNWSAVGHAPTATIYDTLNKVSGTVAKNSLYPYFHLAFAKWETSKLFIVAGIQPIASNGPLDLIERTSVPNTNNYKSAALITWVVGTNASCAGLKVGAPILNGGVKVGAELFSTVVSPRTQAFAADPIGNPSASMFVLDIPVSVAALKVTPQVVAILNRNYSTALKAGDNEIGYGLAGSYKVNDMLNTTFCFGMASLSNANSDTTTGKVYENAGMVVGAGASYKVGPGAAIVDFKYSSDENKKVVDSKSGYVYADAKYGWDVNKNFQIMPRVRFFLKQYEKTNANTSEQEIRPELIFTGKF
ncbi:MAG: hypothetical protein JNL74_24220 [Fibrobacteres bacterium]|nr:hypothetical protein [Fibrobacterota bacterium]